MPCRRQAHEAPAGAYPVKYDHSSIAEMETLKECYKWRSPQLNGAYYEITHPQRGWAADQEYNYWRRSLPEAYNSGWQGAAVEAEHVVGRHGFRMADVGGNVQVMFVNNLHVHVHQHPAQDLLISEEKAAIIPARIDGFQQQAADVVLKQPPPQVQQLHFDANDPDFHHCTYDPQGLDFGRKLMSRLYRAEKHVHSRYNMITYTQCASTAQAISHALTLYLSYKRSKHAIFLFDCGGLVDQLTSDWPSNIHFSDIESLIQQLGPDYEYHRCKLKNERFSLYIYVVKRIGVRFSEQGRRTWSSLFQWAHSLQGSSMNYAGSDVSSTQVIAQVATIGLSIVGAL
ncbi:hypothetical protein L7F22_064513 [Adiantum nelumboides]|nr:hypothetical protein [Adiantum nelumboides]